MRVKIQSMEIETGIYGVDIFCDFDGLVYFRFFAFHFFSSFNERLASISGWLLIDTLWTIACAL